MKKHILLSLAAIVLSFTSCVKPEEGGEDNPPVPQEQISIPSTVDVKPVVSPEGGETKITFTAAAAWTASVISTKADSWVDVNPKSGNAGAAEIKITTTPNDTYVERNATIQIKCGTQTEDIVLTQKQLDNITVTTDKVELGVEGGTFTVELKTNIDFSYEIDGDWIKYVSTKAYSDKTLTFTAEPNDGVQRREGSVTVKGGGFSETVKVYQSGEEPTLVISQSEYNLEAEGGSIVVEVSSNVAVKMTIPEDALWITENQTKSVSTSTFHLEIAANETAEARSADITFSNEETGLSEKVTVNQEGNGSINVPEIVDLGLSVKWASFNVGASKPEEYGGYYQWAGIKDVSDTSIYLDWDNCPYHIGSDPNTGWTKYVDSSDPSSWSGTGNPDDKTVLDPEDDVAHVTLGDKWRMPTHAEFDELCANCTWTWTQLNGVNGYKVTSNKSGYSDKWIFLPAAGDRFTNVLANDGGYGEYWSSSPYYWASMAKILEFGSYEVHNSYCTSRYGGKPVRPVYDDLGDDKVRVTGVSVSPYDISLNVGETFTLSATVFPSNATNQTVTWVSNDYDIATVDLYSGKVTAVKEGITFIHARTSDGDYWSACEVTVRSSDPAVPEVVDLGLPSGLKWATCNIGATKPEEYGDYYAWGETETYYEDGYAQEDPQNHWKTGYATDGYDWSNYKWCNGRYDNRTKYCVSSYHGTVDNKSTLDLDDDVAHVTLGGKWRMPTVDEVDELGSYCTWTWTDNYNGTGVAGQIVTSKVPGYTDKSIFLPAAGYRRGKSLYSVGTGCCYWSSSLSVFFLSAVWNNFSYGGPSSSNIAGIGTSGADFGRTVRPVYGEFINVSSVTLNRDNINLKWGEPETLVAYLMPWNATNQQIAWHSSNPNVASVDIHGHGEYVIINPIYNGTAIVTAYAGDGTLSASCSVTVSGAPGPDEVDLGLSVKWASCNLGASSPEEYGGYYQWAGLEDVTSTSIHLDWRNCPYHTGSHPLTGWTKYVHSDESSYWSGSGSPDNKTVLDPSDDVAHVKLGGKWRMPTDAEWTELRENCTWTWTDNYNGTGISGSIVTSKKSGYTSKSIFLPTADLRNSDDYPVNAGSYGYYWSSSLYTGYPYYANGVYFRSGDVDWYYYERYRGLSVRPVSE